METLLTTHHKIDEFDEDVYYLEQEQHYGKGDGHGYGYGDGCGYGDGGGNGCHFGV